MDEATREDIIKEIRHITSSLNDILIYNYVQIREQYTIHYEWPELDSIRHEICLCIIFDLNQAAISLTNHLLENFVKEILISDCITKVRDEIHNNNFHKHLKEVYSRARQKYGEQNLSNNLREAKRIGLLDDSEFETLDNFRVIFRNAYSHADKAKTLGDTTVPVEPFEFKDGEFISLGNQTEIARDLYLAQGIVQALLAKEESIPYFKSIDSIIRKKYILLFGEDHPQ